MIKKNHFTAQDNVPVRCDDV